MGQEPREPPGERACLAPASRRGERACSGPGSQHNPQARLHSVILYFLCGSEMSLLSTNNSSISDTRVVALVSTNVRSIFCVFHPKSRGCRQVDVPPPTYLGDIRAEDWALYTVAPNSGCHGLEAAGRGGGGALACLAEPSLGPAASAHWQLLGADVSALEAEQKRGAVRPQLHGRPHPAWLPEPWTSVPAGPRERRSHTRRQDTRTRSHVLALTYAHRLQTHACRHTHTQGPAALLFTDPVWPPQPRPQTVSP